MGREENVKVFQDTERLVKAKKGLSDSIRYSTANQLLIPECTKVSDWMQAEEPACAKDAQVIVSKKRTFEAASAYRGKQICVLNFASATNPGGGVTKGSSAQEECLCRCSTLYFNLNTSSMWNGFYTPHRVQGNPLHNDDIIYTPKVVVFKTDTEQPKLLNEADWYTVNVITCAAPNLREKPSNGMNLSDGDTEVKLTADELHQLHEKRLTRILNVAKAGKNEVVILGAFGCGAFKNAPEVVARAAKDTIKEFMRSFETIEFAVYCSPWDDRNYRIFERVIKK